MKRLNNPMIRSVQRTLAVLESFSPDETSLTLQQIADRIDLPKSTTFRIVQSIERAGYLVRLEDQRYCLSFRLLRLAGLVKSTLDVRDITRPVASELAEKSKETITLQMLSDGKRVCIDAISTSSTLRSVTPPGEQVSLAAGASSKTLVAYMPAKAQGPIVAQIAKATGRSQSDVRSELATIRTQGYAVSHGERLLGVSAVSAPIKGVDEQVRYCLSLVGPSVRVQMRERELIKLVVAAAADISLQYGAGIAASLSKDVHA